MQSIFVIGGIALAIVIILIIILAPSMRDRGYRDQKAKTSYERDLYLERERELAKRELKDKFDSGAH